MNFRFFSLYVFFLLFLSVNIYSDERASKGKCYLTIGYVPSQAGVKDFILQNQFDPSVYEIFERKDKKIYFTLGKINKKLFDSAKKKEMLDDKFFCTSGKGFNVRYNIDSNLNLVGGRGSKQKANKKFIDTAYDLETVLEKKDTISLVSNPQPSTSINPNSVQPESSSLVSEQREIKQMFGPSQNGEIFREQYKEFESIADSINRVILSMNPSSVGSYFALKDKEDRNFKVSLTWGIYLNENFDAFLTDIEGRRFINPKTNLRTEFITVEDNMPVWNNFEFYLKEFMDLGIYKSAIESMHAALEAKVANHYDSLNLTNGKKPTTRYTKLSDWKFILQEAGKKRCKPFVTNGFKSSYIVVAPVACVISYEDGNMTQLYWPDVAKLKKIGEVNLLDFLKKGVDEKAITFSNFSDAFSADPKNNFTLTTINDGLRAKVCYIDSGSPQKNSFILAHLASKYSEKDKNRSKVMNEAHKFATLNDMYIEISQIKDIGCGTLLLSLEDFSKLAKAMGASKPYSIMNPQVVKNVFNAGDAKQSFAKIFRGLDFEKIKNFESITSMKITPENARYFIDLEAQLQSSNLEFNKENFAFVKALSNQIFLNSYLSNMIGVVKYDKKFKRLGYDLMNPETTSRIKNVFKNNGIKILKDQNKLEIYLSLLSSMTPDEIDEMFLILKKIKTKISDDSYHNLYKYYKAQLEVANSKSLSLDTHLDNIIKEREAAAIANEARREAAAIANEARRKVGARQRKLREQEEKERFVRNYPYSVYVSCSWGDREVEVGRCMVGDGGKININDAGSSWEIVGTSVYVLDVKKGKFVKRNGGLSWKVDLSSSWKVTASMSYEAYGTLRLETKDNRTGRIISTKRCNTDYCAVSMRAPK